MLFDNLDHHAYLLVGERKGLIEFVTAGLERLTGQPITNQPDVVWQEASVFSIEDSRRLGEQQARRAFDGRCKFFVIVTDSITLPAQQALLKIFEEPAPRTHFFLIGVRTADLLPTFLSRCQIIKRISENHPVEKPLTGEENDPTRMVAERFLASSPSERLELIRESSEVVDNLIPALELVCHERLLKNPSRVLAATLETIVEAGKYLNDQGSLPKLIGEHLALTLPVWPIQDV